jgi:putative ATPase
LYDRNGDQHYDIISALHKSIRGSDSDAALYWLGRMLEAGEDPLYIARRLVRCASEDIGLADNTALPLVKYIYIIKRTKAKIYILFIGNVSL